MPRGVEVEGSRCCWKLRGSRPTALGRVPSPSSTRPAASGLPERCPGNPAGRVRRPAVRVLTEWELHPGQQPMALWASHRCQWVQAVSAPALPLVGAQAVLAGAGMGGRRVSRGGGFALGSHCPLRGHFCLSRLLLRAEAASQRPEQARFQVQADVGSHLTPALCGVSLLCLPTSLVLMSHRHSPHLTLHVTRFPVGL